MSLRRVIQIISVFLLAAVSIPSTVECGMKESDKGIIVDLSGEVFIHRKTGRFNAFESCKLLLNDTIMVSKESKCGGIAPGSEWFELIGPSTMVLTRKKSGFENWLERQLDDFIGGKRLHRMVTRSAVEWDAESRIAAPILPVEGGRVRGSGAGFHWHKVPGVTSYTVTFVDSEGGEVVYTARKNSITLTGLNQGEVYSWKVEPDVSGWNTFAEWRSFQVLSDDEEKILDRTLKEVPDIRAGVLLIASGLYGEAIQRFETAIDEDSSSRSAMVWRARALAAAGLYSEAYEDLMIILKEE